MSETKNAAALTGTVQPLLVRCCMNCANGETSFEQYGELIHGYESEDVFCHEKQELETLGKTTVCEKWENKTKFKCSLDHEKQRLNGWCWCHKCGSSTTLPNVTGEADK